MALKPTIYKANVALSDMDRDYYDQLQLTMAQHPSETSERLLVRMLVFCLNAHPDLSFTRGLSSVDEPELWQRSLDGRIVNWIEVGQPDVQRIKKSANKSQSVRVYAFGKSAETWWQLHGQELMTVPHTQIFMLSWVEIQQLNQVLARTMDLSVTIAGNTLYVSTVDNTLEVSVKALGSL